MLRLRSFIYFVFLIITIIPYFLLCLFTAVLPLNWRYQITMGWPRLAIWGARTFCGIRWQVIGAENLPQGPAVLLSKHQSAWETLFFLAHLPRPCCFVYKRQLHWIPFFGWGLAFLRMIPIDRSKSRSAFEQIIKQGQRCLDEGKWPLLFPEGTRVPPGKTMPYKQGGARLAAATGHCIIPIAHNSAQCWGFKTFIKRPGLITLSIGPAIQTKGISVDKINYNVQHWIENEMRRLNPEFTTTEID